MKKILLVLIAATLLTSVYAQDLLVIEGNSINCRINREYKNYVSYTYREGKDIREGLVERSKITAMVKDFYAESDISKEAINALSDAKGVPWLIGISFGGGYRIARTASGADADSVNSTRLGYVIEGNANYYFNDYLGCGLKLSMHRAKESITAFFIGPEFAVRYLSPTKKNALYSNVAIGYTGYSDKTSFASTYALAFDVGYDIGISRLFAVGLQLSSFWSSVKIDDTRSEGLARIDLTVGLKIRL